MYNPLIDDIKSEIKIANKGRLAGRLLLLIGVILLCVPMFNIELLLTFEVSGILSCLSGLIFISLSKRHLNKMKEALIQERWKDDIRSKARRELD